MAEVSTSYRKMPGSSWNLIDHVRLYLGPDHVLQVTMTYHQETYKRFYFTDIQAVQIRRTDVGNAWSVGFTGGAFIFLILALAFGGIAGWILVGIAGVFLIGLLINLVAGPTSVTLIRTAVQTDRLRSLGRLRQARKFLARTQPLIEAAQANLPAPAPASASTDRSAQSSSFDVPPVIEPDVDSPNSPGFP
jgi:hypothetical protein